MFFPKLYKWTDSVEYQFIEGVQVNQCADFQSMWNVICVSALNALSSQWVIIALQDVYDFPPRIEPLNEMKHKSFSFYL